MPNLTFQWNSVPKLILGAEVRRLVPKLFRAEVTRAKHRLPHSKMISHKKGEFRSFWTKSKTLVWISQIIEIQKSFQIISNSNQFPWNYTLKSIFLIFAWAVGEMASENPLPCRFFDVDLVMSIVSNTFWNPDRNPRTMGSSLDGAVTSPAACVPLFWL